MHSRVLEWDERDEGERGELQELEEGRLLGKEEKDEYSTSIEER